MYKQLKTKKFIDKDNESNKNTKQKNLIVKNINSKKQTINKNNNNFLLFDKNNLENKAKSIDNSNCISFNNSTLNSQTDKNFNEVSIKDYNADTYINESNNYLNNSCTTENIKVYLRIKPIDNKNLQEVKTKKCINYLNNKAISIVKE